MGVWDKIERAVFNVAEGIGKKFEQGTALPGRGANWVKGGGLQSAIGRINQMHGLGGRVANTAGVLRSMISGGPNAGLATIARQQFGGFGQKLAAHGFVSTPREYFQNLGAAGRNAGAFVANRAAGLGSRIGGGLRAFLGGGTAAGTPATENATPPRKINEQFKKMSGPQGLPLITRLFADLGKFTALRGAVELFKKFTFGIGESNRDLAKWNGALAASFAKMDFQQMRLDIQTARATAGGATTLNDAIMELKTEFQPIRENTARLLNIVGIAGVNLLRTAVAGLKAFAANNELLKGIADAIEAAEKELKKKKPDDQFPGNQALDAVARLRGRGNVPVGGNVGANNARGAFIARPVDPRIARPGVIPPNWMQGGGF